MSKIEIFSTGYEWNWLNTLNRFIDGVAFGAGIVLVVILFVLFINIKSTGKSKEKKEKQS